MRKLRAVVIEDETMFRQLIVATLGEVKNLEIIGEFSSGKPALKFCLARNPDLAVIDLVLPDIDGLQVARKIRKARPDMKVLIITAHPSAELPLALVQLGINGYIDKTEPIAYVLNAVATIRRGGMFFASHVKPSDSNSRQSAKLPIPLTERQKEIARLVAGGRMSKEIANRLNLSLRTVEKHREHIMHKIGVRDVASLTRWCIRAGVVDPASPNL
ncbi:MAG: response regulator transcription factor [Opitutus sp.]